LTLVYAPANAYWAAPAVTLVSMNPASVGPSPPTPPAPFPPTPPPSTPPPFLNKANLAIGRGRTAVYEEVDEPMELNASR
jgi:hypothetical protein